MANGKKRKGARPARLAAAPAPAAASRPRKGLAWGLGAAGLGGLALALLLAANPGHAFNKERAFKDLETQVRFGPRVPNTDGHRQCSAHLVSILKPLADSVERQEFTQVIRGKSLKMVNVIARWKGAGDKNGVLLCAHWDTRPTADQERDIVRARRPIPGANDGASGVAVLLEAARAFKAAPPPVPVMLVFFDGEDYGPGEEDMFLGARYFADHLPQDVPKRGVLLDMVGDRDLEIPREPYSVENAREVSDQIYDIADKLGLNRYFPRRTSFKVEDDHLPLQAKGLQVIDLIDFNYGPNNSWWHTLDDTPDKCSPTSLKVVGDVVLEWVYTRK
jgi:glutaminyl-peptide cyclotransferase